MNRFVLLFLGAMLFCCFRISDHSMKFQNNTEIHEGPCAIFLAPTDGQLDTMKMKMKESDFYKLVDDNMAYLSNARVFLDSKNLAIINLEATGSIKLKKSNGKIIDFPIYGLKWSVILFNGKSDPIIANKVSVENDYRRYMK